LADNALSDSEKSKADAYDYYTVTPAFAGEGPVATRSRRDRHRQSARGRPSDDRRRSAAWAGCYMDLRIAPALQASRASGPLIDTFDFLGHMREVRTAIESAQAQRLSLSGRRAVL
jgi:hypothetical protein